MDNTIAEILRQLQKIDRRMDRFERRWSWFAGAFACIGLLGNTLAFFVCTDTGRAIIQPITSIIRPATPIGRTLP